MNVIDAISRAYIINLPARTDRRRQMEQVLGRMALKPESGRVEFFPAIRPDFAGDFPGVGARGCFLSHLAILRRALADRLPNVLVMEDDLEIAPILQLNSQSIFNSLHSLDWDMAYLGHTLGEAIRAVDGQGWQLFSGPIATTHFYAVRGRCLPELVAFLDAVLGRPPGHPDGGPMHVDGAFSTFRAQNPSVVTLVASPSLGWQRSSKSDITTNKYDNMPFIRHLMEPLRRIRRKYYQ